MRALVLAAAVAAAAAIVLCVTGCSSPAAVGESSLDSFDIPDSLLHSSYFHQTVHWVDCGDGSDDDCAKVRAPIDWTGRDAGSIELAMLRHRATGSRLGTLLVNPGGPGASGVDFVGGDVTDVVTPEIAEHYDVIGFDPRGVGNSSAVRCGGAKSIDALLYSPLPGAIGSAPWIDANLARARHFARACRTGSGSLLDHIDTVSAAHDLELLRVALDQKKLDYLGYSYGTYLGTVYAGLHPTGVGRFVLDGAVDPWYSDGEIGLDGRDTNGGFDPDAGFATGSNPDDISQEVGFDRALSDFVKACLAGDATATGGKPCPFSGSPADATATITDELSAASAHPLRGTDGRQIDGAGLATAIGAALYSTDQWPDLARMFTQVAAGDSTEAFQLADGYNGRDSDGSYDGNEFEANLAISCLESGSRYNLTADRAELKQLKISAPVLGPYSAYSDLGCAGWGGPAPWPEPITAPVSGPIVVVSTTNDPATPYDSGVALAHQLANGHLVSFTGDGHTAYDKGNSCVDGTVDAFLLHGTVPSHDPHCH